MSLDCWARRVLISFNISILSREVEAVAASEVLIGTIEGADVVKLWFCCTATRNPLLFPPFRWPARDEENPVVSAILRAAIEWLYAARLLDISLRTSIVRFGVKLVGWRKKSSFDTECAGKLKRWSFSSGLGVTTGIRELLLPGTTGKTSNEIGFCCCLGIAICCNRGLFEDGAHCCCFPPRLADKWDGQVGGCTVGLDMVENVLEVVKSVACRTFRSSNFLHGGASA